jgi:hypothetical protein
VDRQVRGAVEGLFAPDRDPDTTLVRLIKKRVHNLSTKDIKASLQRVRIHFDFPDKLVRDLAKPLTRQRRPPAREAERPSARKKAHVGVSLQDLIAENLLKPPLKLISQYRAKDLDATLQHDGSVEFQGTRYTSCSTAADAARQTVIGGHPHTNGWTFWQFRDDGGQLVALDRVRQQFLRKRIVPLERGQAGAGHQSA